MITTSRLLQGTDGFGGSRSKHPGWRDFHPMRSHLSLGDCKSNFPRNRSALASAISKALSDFAPMSGAGGLPELNTVCATEARIIFPTLHREVKPLKPRVGRMSLWHLPSGDCKYSRGSAQLDSLKPGNIFRPDAGRLINKH